MEAAHALLPYPDLVEILSNSLFSEFRDQSEYSTQWQARFSGRRFILRLKNSIAYGI
jgi:hypothetical protein